MMDAATHDHKNKSTAALMPDEPALSVRDIQEVLKAGVRDFRQAPAYGLFFGGIYAVGGWLLILMLLYFDVPYLVYPLAAGFALIAPFIASSFYHVSRQLEFGKAITWPDVFASLRLMFRRDLGWMALVTGFSLFIWMDMAALLTFGFFGMRTFVISDLFNIILTTPMGILFLAIGNTVGAVIAFFVFSISVISIPMLYHRDIDFITAMITSVKLVRKNPRPMVLWFVTIALLIGASMASALIGLFVVLPILGHASWHLYRRSVPQPTDSPT